MDQKMDIFELYYIDIHLKPNFWDVKLFVFYVFLLLNLSLMREPVVTYLMYQYHILHLYRQ